MVKTILHHLGLGDQIMLNGMVRHFAETDNVVIFAKRCHEESVRFMYRDIQDRVEIILLDTINPNEIWKLFVCHVRDPSLVVATLRMVLR